MQTTRPSNITQFLVPLLAAMIVSGPLAGCREKIDSATSSTRSTKPRQDSSPTATPLMESILTAWQQGDQAGAVRRFLDTDWSQRPLFSPGTTLNLSEAQFQALPTASRETKAPEMMTQVGDLKTLAEAVAHAGRDAAARNDTRQARKHFTALQQFGTALDSAGSLGIVRLVGQAVKKKAEAETARLGP